MVNTKIPVELSSTPGIVDNSNATAITIDSSENVGIGTTSPDSVLHVSDTSQPKITIEDSTNNSFGRITGGGSTGSLTFEADFDNAKAGTVMTFNVDNTERMRIDSSGNVGIGVTSSYPLTVQSGTAGSNHAIALRNNSTNNLARLGFLQQDSATAAYTSIDGDGRSTGYLKFNTNDTERMRIDSSGRVGLGSQITSNEASTYDSRANDFVVSGAGDTGITIAGGSSEDIRLVFTANGTTGLSKGSFTYDNANDSLAVETGGSERMRIDNEVQFFKNDGSLTTAGVFIQSSGRYLGTTNSNIEPMILNRQDNDGILLELRQANSVEGTISVSGSTVSYNGFSGTHETSGISTDAEIGTVCSTIDELDTYTSGTKEGQTRADHAKIKVSDTVGDTRVYGVLSKFDNNNKPIVASVGIGSIKVTGACSGGDLLESNGDGTAKVQSDDIVRSKTIGKVTIGNSDTGVKLVSCVLYCG